MLHVITGQISHLTDECTPYFSLLSFTLSCEFPSPFSITLFYVFVVHSHGLTSPWILLSFSLHFSQQLSPLCTILQSHSAFRPQSYSISLTPSRTSPCFSLRVQKMCKNTFSITDLERILAWCDPHEPDLSKLTLYTEFTALINQHFNLWLYVFSLASQIM